MWLVNVETFRLHYFINENVPKYAILSHRWEDEELSFADMRDCQMIDSALSRALEDEELLFPALAEIRRYRIGKLKSLKGWNKLNNFCKKSRAFDFEWAWIDTVCIDKSSSSELQEAINSMFEWYENSGKCFVYLFDVTSDPLNSLGDYKNELRRSSWFKRGWTLQELLAPRFGSFLFLNRSWEIIGTDEDFIDDIVSITRIPKNILTRELTSTRRAFINYCSVAQRFSWAAPRQVTRGEDAAYSLLGIFNVNMPMLYGEGKSKSFERLQEEILKKSRDESILAWNIGSTDEFHRKYSDKSLYLLAKSPQEFADCGKIKKRVFNVDKNKMRGRPHQMIPSGLLMEAMLIDRKSGVAPLALLQRKDWITRYALPLFVRSGNQAKGSACADTVIAQLNHWNGDEYHRHEPNFIARLDWNELQRYHELQQLVICSSEYFSSLD